MCTKLIASNPDVDQPFKSIHPSIVTKIEKKLREKNYACRNTIVLDVTTKHSIKFFECYIIKIQGEKKS